MKRAQLFRLAALPLLVAGVVTTVVITKNSLAPQHNHAFAGERDGGGHRDRTIDTVKGEGGGRGGSDRTIDTVKGESGGGSHDRTIDTVKSEGGRSGGD